MQANPGKFQVLAVRKKTYEKRPTINIQNFELTCEDSVKLLGIEIDYQLNFDTHIRDRPFNLQGGGGGGGGGYGFLFRSVFFFGQHES